MIANDGAKSSTREDQKWEYELWCGHNGNRVDQSNVDGCFPDWKTAEGCATILAAASSSLYTVIDGP